MKMQIMLPSFRANFLESTELGKSWFDTVIIRCFLSLADGVVAFVSASVMRRVFCFLCTPEVPPPQ